MKFYCLAFVALLSAIAFPQSRIPPLSLGAPATSGNVTIIPILSVADSTGEKGISLVAAAKAGLVEIYSVPGAGYQVAVHSEANVPLILVSGEVIVGGPQDQIIEQDVAVLPGESDLVAVMCVEAGRSKGARLYQAGDYLVPDWIRSTAIRTSLGATGHPQGQDLVWKQVAALNKAVGKSPETGTARAALEDSKLIRDAGELSGKLLSEVDDTQFTVGTMVAINGSIVSADLFGSHRLFELYRPALLKAYAVEGVLLHNDGAKGPAIGPASTDFLSRILASNRIGVSRGATGVVYRLEGGVLGAELGTLEFSGEVAPLRPGFLHGFYVPL